MSSAAFSRAVAVILDHEGGYSNDPNDPGGETNFGISKRSYPDEDIKRLTKERAIELYHRDFWLSIRGDELPYPLALVTFDAAVNSGPAVAVRWMQGALGVAADGKIGPVTLASAQMHQHDNAVLVAAIRRRILYCTQLRNWQYAGASWVQRSLDTLLQAVTP